MVPAVTPGVVPAVRVARRVAVGAAVPGAVVGLATARVVVVAAVAAAVVAAAEHRVVAAVELRAIGREALQRGVHVGEFLKLNKAWVKDLGIRTVIDVGSHRGFGVCAAHSGCHAGIFGETSDDLRQERDTLEVTLPAPADVTLVDRSNHHVFQPLLYQVATAEHHSGGHSH